MELQKQIKLDPDHLDPDTPEEPDYQSVDEDESPLDNQVCHFVTASVPFRAIYLVRIINDILSFWITPYSCHFQPLI